MMERKWSIAGPERAAGCAAVLLRLTGAAPADDSHLFEVTSSGAALPPRQSVHVTVRTQGEFDHVSVAGMLISTSDGFFARNDVAGPTGTCVATSYSPPHDLGTEADDEFCAHTPGPPAVCRGEGLNPSRAGGVNFVHMHPSRHSRHWRPQCAAIRLAKSGGAGDHSSESMSARGAGAAKPVLHLADSVLYVSALLRDRPRRIDDYIDYFGTPRLDRPRASAGGIRRALGGFIWRMSLG
jgi:hypothetical protein